MEYVSSNPQRRKHVMTPEVAGTVFAVALAFMLLFPFVRLTLAGSSEPDTVLFLTKTDFGLNIFALVLILVPVLGVAASLFLRREVALIVDSVLAIVGVVMIPLAVLTLAHEAAANASLDSHVLPGVGMGAVLILLVVVAVTSGIAAFQARS
ncbi:MAG: hypothetical protein ABI338_05640 [Gemmatimonadaceae bacterium]